MCHTKEEAKAYVMEHRKALFHRWYVLLPPTHPPTSSVHSFKATHPLHPLIYLPPPPPTRPPTYFIPQKKPNRVGAQLKRQVMVTRFLSFLGLAFGVVPLAVSTTGTTYRVDLREEVGGWVG